MIRIKYAALCHKGLIRSKNQDNFWCANVFLESKNEGLTELIAGTTDSSVFQAFAVFDGMGGEQQGEVAAYIAASHFNELLLNAQVGPGADPGAGPGVGDPKKFLLDACLDMNRKICEYRKENNIRQMGATAAILICCQDGAFIGNVGDSRIYQINGKKMSQISRDHSEKISIGKKAPLSQNLGIPETEFIIEPYIAKGEYRNGDKFLLCSDGLTDMVSDEEIRSITTPKKSVSDTVKELVETALEKGGRDNITVIVCELRKQSRFFNFGYTRKRKIKGE
ncbi:MAG: protein phosphatase 2C domain-containing protein [Oscillospiraceae bacterium]|nr:protein phosphatase 2C domain-containing protein [Oscillospiraceae bacterium]